MNDSSQPTESTPAAAKPLGKSQRLVSLDVYRGLIMVTLAFNGFGLAATAKNHLESNPGSSFWQAVSYQFEHAEWAGCAYWDLIQPSFMFMVGASMAYSYLRRQAEGHSYLRMLGHAAWRSVILMALGIFLTSNGSKSTAWSFMNVLTQMGLGYVFLFLCWGRTFRTQGIVAAALLAGTWLLYVAYPGSGVELATGAEKAGITKEWAAENLANISPAWHKNANVGQAIDHWILNLFPQQEPFTFNRGGYQTINFIPSLATMIFGLMCGELLRSSRSGRQKVKILLLAGVGGLVAGQLLHSTGVCPIVKRIWSPSWALFSTGWACLFLGTLYALIDLAQFKRWAWPLMVVGMNSIAVYCMSMTLKPWVARTLQTHLGSDVFKSLGDVWSPFVQATLVGLSFWMVCWWMLRQKFFIRI